MVGSTCLRPVLTEAGWAASRTKDNYLSAQYRQIARCLGKKQACIAVGHRILRLLLTRPRSSTSSGKKA